MFYFIIHIKYNNCKSIKKIGEEVLKTLFKNAKILNLNEEIGYIKGCVEVTDNIITYVGKNVPKCAYDRIIDVQDNILMPGFVNAHAHTPMTLLRGVKDNYSSQDWLSLEEQITEEDVYWGEMLGIAEYVRNGITSIEDRYFHLGAMSDAIAKSGIRARIGIGCKIHGKKSTDSYANMNETYRLIKSKTNPNLVSVVCSAHSLYAEDEENFFDILKFSNDYNLPLSIHLSETLKEVGDCTLKHNQMTPPAYLESLGYLDRECLCYNCIHMDKDDLQILADYSASVATCPSSNIKLANGIAPVYAMQNKGLNIAIGTDGAASNNSLDMFKEMFLVATLSKVSLYDSSVVSAREVIEMATLNGAKALGINSGEIAVGKNADIILVSTKEPHMQPDKNIISNLVYSARGNDVYLTMVAGKILYENGKYNIGEKIEEICKKANEIRNRLEN